MRISRFQLILALLGSSTAALRPLEAAPGDLIATVAVPDPCPRGIAHVGFDGTLLYYTIRGEQNVGTIYKVEAATGTPRGSLVLKRQGTPVTALGLGYDASRRSMWTSGSSMLRLFSPDSGDITWEFMLLRQATRAVAHDALSDRLWEPTAHPMK